jgi:hypothetical protein
MELAKLGFSGRLGVEQTAEALKVFPRQSGGLEAGQGVVAAVDNGPARRRMLNGGRRLSSFTMAPYNETRARGRTTGLRWRPRGIIHHHIEPACLPPQPTTAGQAHPSSINSPANNKLPSLIKGRPHYGSNRPFDGPSDSVAAANLSSSGATPALGKSALYSTCRSLFKG